MILVVQFVQYVINVISYLCNHIIITLIFYKLEQIKNDNDMEVYT